MIWYILAIVAIAFVFDFINGFHDSANSIATVVGTRVLKPLQAVAWAAFWNFIAATRNWDEDTVAWARKRNISFNEVDAQGDLPLATLLHKISHEAGVTDFFSSANGSMAAMILAMADPGGQAAKDFEFLEDLALEMVRSGVDLMHKNKQGLATAGNMFPEQASALIAQIGRELGAGAGPLRWLHRKAMRAQARTMVGALAVNVVSLEKPLPKTQSHRASSSPSAIPTRWSSIRGVPESRCR